jgi:DNA-binding transcriptional ArsR family regulator
MRVMDLTRTAPRLQVDIEASIAYEFLISLTKFSSPEDAETYESGPEWFENIRTSASQELLSALERFGYTTKPFGMVARLMRRSPRVVEVSDLIRRLEDTDPGELRMNLLGYYAPWIRPEVDREQIRHAAEGDRDAQQALIDLPAYMGEDRGSNFRRLIELGLDETKELLLEIFRRWYAEVFASEEPGLRPILERDAEAKRAMAGTMSPEQLIEAATNGLEYRPSAWTRHIVLTPHVTLRPWNAMNSFDDVTIVAYPVADESMGIDATAPPARLVRLHKALGDEKRLRILKRLAHSSATLQELADAAGVAKSTAHHHTVILRSAGLIRVTLEEDSRYTLRREFIPEASGWLEAFLEGRTA